MNNFWQAAARGGFWVGVIGVFTAAGKVWLGAGVGMMMLELMLVGWCIFRLGKARGEQTFGQALWFVMAMMLFAGAIYGLGYYFLVNYWAVDFFTRQMDQAWEAMQGMAVAADRGMVLAMWRNPLFWVLYGVIAEVFFGFLVALFVVPFYRKR